MKIMDYVTNLMKHFSLKGVVDMGGHSNERGKHVGGHGGI